MRHSICLSLVLISLSGCGEIALDAKAPLPAAPEPDSKPTTRTPIVQLVATPAAPIAEPWSNVKGRVVWAGDLPKREPVAVKKDHADHKFCMKDGEFPEDTWIIDPKSKGLKNAFVYLLPADPDGKLAIHPNLAKIADNDKKVFIDQPVCMFVPHALAMREGQILVVKNTSKVLHNFKWGGNPDINPGGNPTITAGDQLEIKDIKADRNLIIAECGIHPWMRSSVMAFDHPYFAVTDAQGRFSFKDAPAGACRLMIRHSTGIYAGGAKGRKGQPITIQAGDTDLGSLEFPAP